MLECDGLCRSELMFVRVCGNELECVRLCRVVAG